MACQESGGKQQRRFTMTDLKHQAVEYYRNNEVPQRLEEVLNTMFYHRPADFYGYLYCFVLMIGIVHQHVKKSVDQIGHGPLPLSKANYFCGLSKPPVICKLIGKRVLDGIGRPALEVEVSCRIREREKRVCSSMISSHAEMLENASSEVFDADEKERHESLNTAVEWINESLNEMFRGLQPTDQYNIDKLLGEYFSKKTEEDKRKREAEKDKETQEAVLPVSQPPPVAPTSGKRKSTKPGKKASMMEKPIQPAEPTEPIVKGSMAIGCVSLALAKTAAIIREIPLYLHIALLKPYQEAPKELAVPLPMITVLNCGKSSPGKLNLMKEVMLIPPAWLTIKQAIERCMDIQKQLMKLVEPPVQQPSSMGESKKPASRDAVKRAPLPVLKKMSHLGCLVIGSESVEHPLNLIQSACANLSLQLGTDMYLGLNCAAHELMDYNKGKYEILLGTHKTADEMVDVYLELTNKFPSIITFIDPLRKEDKQQWIVLRNTLGSKCYLIAEDCCRNVSKLLEDNSMSTPKCRGLVLKYVNETKISDLVQMTQLLDDRKRISVLGSPDGESTDDSLVDLAVGLGTKFIKLGGLSRGERVTKYNRLLAIEEELGKNGRLCEREEHEFDFIEEEEEEEEELDYTDFASGTAHTAL